MSNQYDLSVKKNVELGDGTGSDTTDVNGFLRLERGTNKQTGTLTLNGTTEVTVANTSVKTTSIILLGGYTPAGTPASAYVFTKTNGVGFSVKGAASDTSVIGYVILDAADADVDTDS